MEYCIWAEFLEKTERNMTWEEIVSKTLKKDEIKSIEDAYEYIIGSSVTGRDLIDEVFKLK